MSFLYFVLSSHVILTGFYYHCSPAHSSDWWQSDWAAQGGRPVALPHQWERHWCSPYLPGKWVRWWKHSHEYSLSTQDGLHAIAWPSVRTWQHWAHPLLPHRWCWPVQPVREEELTIFSLLHVCQADVVIFVLLNDRYLRVLYKYLCHIVCCITNFTMQSYSFSTNYR